MKAVGLTGCILLSIATYGQEFINTFSAELPDSAVQAKVEWVDLDNDGLLDVFTFATRSSGQHFFVTFKNDTVRGLVDIKAHETGFSSAVYRIADVDLDNDLDILVSGWHSNGGRTSFFENQSGFNFSERTLLPIAASFIRFADVTADATPELILSGRNNSSSFFNIYQYGSPWRLMHDSLKIEASSIEIVDFDGDSDNDIFVSGKENDNSVSKLLLNEGAMYFKSSTLSMSAVGNTSVGDVNHDNRLDIFLTGIDDSGQNRFINYRNQRTTFIAKDTLAPIKNGNILLADFDADGLCDLQKLGEKTSGDTLNVILLRNGDLIPVNKSKLHAQTFGDYNRDGNLDLLQVLEESSALVLQVSRNEFSAKNQGPYRPQRAFGFTIFKKLFLYWDKSTDDHTPQKAITYDVTLQTPNAELMVGEFDLFNHRRLTVSHGNAGTKNYFLLKPKNISTFNYAVQAVDNSFMSYYDPLITGEVGICSGTGSRCETQEVVDVSACKNETLTFSATPGAQWFSLSKGFLAEGSTFKMKVVAPDTVFSFAPDAGCPSLKIYLIKIENVTVKTTETRFFCEGQGIPFKVESDWTNILWKSQVRGFLGSAMEITYLVSQPDTVTLKVSNEFGCGREHKTALHVSKPLISLAGDSYQILKGESIQLTASGGESYSWAPAESLDNSSIAMPIASPLSSTFYTVTVTDSIGCTATANVQVLVEGTAFIPNLFTPNDDGKNDEVKVYGLPAVSNFSFVIHNREGSVLYETKDAAQASGNGWDGTVKGVKQPAGVYYWKVKGEHASGRKLLLNGKTTGSIVLIR